MGSPVSPGSRDPVHSSQSDSNVNRNQDGNERLNRRVRVTNDTGTMVIQLNLPPDNSQLPQRKIKSDYIVENNLAPINNPFCR